MSLTTTKARLVSVSGGVSGIAAANVRCRVATDIDRVDAEAAYISGGAVNALEYVVLPSALHGGASGLYRSAARVKGYLLGRAADGSDAFGTFTALIETLFLALINPVTGFPQIDPAGIQLTDLSETPKLLRTGHSAYVASFGFGLLDVDNT